MGDHKTLMLEKWPCETLRDDRVAVFAERFPSIEKLHEFHEDTRNLAWPEAFGQSPWEFTSMVAHLVFTCEAKVPDHFHEPWRSDLVHAIEGLENRYILAGERADVFMGVFFRAVAQKMQDRPVRYAAFKFDGLYFRDVHFIAVLQPLGDNPLDGDFRLYRAQYLPTQEEAIGVYPVRQVIKPPSTQVDLTELSRIFRFGNGRDGFQWGDTRRADGNYGAETLACLTLMGYARRTGNNVPNGLGGTWPEVEITPAGVLALMQSKVLGQVQKDMEAHKIAVPVASIASDGAWGDFDFCVRTGAVLGVDASRIHRGFRIEDMPVRIDIAELAKAYPDEDIDGRTYDVLDVGYWTADGRYEAPEENFREELRHCRAAP